MERKGAACITGGAKRIGKALAIALAQEGYDIALHCFSSESDAASTAGQIEAFGRKCKIFRADLGCYNDYASMIDEVFAEFSYCNILINNASLFKEGRFQETDEALFTRHMDINFKAPFFLTQQFAKHCTQGQVINMVDTYVTKHRSPYFIYLLSKKALYDLTRMAAYELGPSIRVNGISPGITELSDGLEEAWLQRKKAMLPLRDIVKIEDIVAAMKHIMSAQYMTGQIISVDGGEHLL